MSPASLATGIPLPRRGSLVHICYRRIARPANTYRQLVLESRRDAIITFQPRAPVNGPLVVDGDTILEPRSPVIWFTYPGMWHDIGLFHRANGTFTGWYANILTPVDLIDERSWATTDLCLDLWIPRRGPVRLLDEAELDDAEREGRIEGELADRARAEATALLGACDTGSWPPAETGEWSLKRALGVCRG